LAPIIFPVENPHREQEEELIEEPCYYTSAIFMTITPIEKQDHFTRIFMRAIPN
jgi:hypothetical protein